MVATGYFFSSPCSGIDIKGTSRKFCPQEVGSAGDYGASCIRGLDEQQRWPSLHPLITGAILFGEGGIDIRINRSPLGFFPAGMGGVPSARNSAVLKRRVRQTPPHWPTD